ncbi:MAG: aldo/keto reductase, partial [Betaproteobacteria bacterium]|nr:aldo/keto reductase [Betaproteobacteria bacterium]
DGSRASLKNMAWMKDQLTDANRNATVEKLSAIAADLDASMAQLAIAWCLKNPNVSTVITGASREPQLQENMKALALSQKLDGDVLARIAAVIGDDHQ